MTTIPASRRIPVLGRLALAALLTILPDLAAMFVGLGAVPEAQAQFAGCPVTGTWIGGPMGADRWNFREEAAGQLSATASPSGAALPGDAFLAPSGTRSGTNVAMTLLLNGTGFPFTALMTDCDHMNAHLIAFDFQLIRTSNTYCGDGNLDAGEDCDDGNFTNGDTCTVLCTNPSCGNRVVEAGEGCDDGNLVQVDGCSNACQPNVCGNTVVESGEVCDDGNQVNGDGCSRVCVPNVCGNGVVESGEQCDDGQPPANGDGCSTLCQFEGCDMSGTWRESFMGGTTFIGENAAHDLDGNLVSNLTAPTGALRITSGNRDGNAVSIVFGGLALTGQMTSCNSVDLTGVNVGLAFTLTRLSTSYCGDGTEDAGEQCDDGNFANGDSCTAVCTDAVCGNGISEPGEQCDDGNHVQADGCSNGCQVNHCGDGSNPPEPGEECDDGDLIDGDGCSATCRINDCGNGIIEPGEQCDDGDQPPADGDGCSALCQYEGCAVGGAWTFNVTGPGAIRLIEAPDGTLTGLYGAASAPTNTSAIGGSRVGNFVTLTLLDGAAVATATQADCEHLDGTVLVGGSAQLSFSAQRLSSGNCGDGIKSNGEQCDDGNTAGDDDCNFLCLLPHCGNGGPLDPFEICDDGNGNPNDACKNDCTPNVCGDAVLNQGVEQCDDGNGNPNDACKNDCTLNVCGDGTLLQGIEHCDDGNPDASDGCDTTCNVEDLAVAALPATGGTVSTDPENDGATPDDPVETAITVPATGTSAVVSIAETSTTVPTGGYQTLGKQVNITAPTTTPQSPMVFVFSLDASVVPAGQTSATIAVFRNGTPVPECPGAVQAVPFDPCVRLREQLGDGDVRISVLSSRASAWNLAARLPLPSSAAAACRKEIRKSVSTLFKNRLGVLARCEDRVRKGRAAGPCPDEDTLARIARAEAALDPTKLANKCPAAVIASLGLQGACAGATDPAALAACVVAEVAHTTNTLAAVEFATPAVAIADKSLRACQAAIATEGGKKFAPKRLKIFDGCNGKVDADDVTACLDPTSAAQLASAEAKLATGIAKKCSDASIVSLGTFGSNCGDASSVASLTSCQRAAHATGTDRLLSLLP